MKINVQSIHFDADVQLLAFIEKKGSKLAQFFDQIIDAEAILRLEKSTIDHKNKLVEFKSGLAGNVEHKEYKIDWQEFDNKIILIKNENLEIIPIERFFIKW